MLQSNVGTSFLLMIEWYFIVWIYHILFIIRVDGHLGYSLGPFSILLR